MVPRGSIYTTIMELGPKRPSPLWFLGRNSIIVVYMNPLGYGSYHSLRYIPWYMKGYWKIRGIIIYHISYTLELKPLGDITIPKNHVKMHFGGKHPKIRDPPKSQ